MPFAIELFLDQRSDQQVRQIWAALDDQGVTSLGMIPDSDYHPHVSLTVFEHGDALQVTDVLRPLIPAAGRLPLPLESLGFFLTEEAPAFLGVVPSARFLSLHKMIHRGDRANRGRHRTLLPSGCLLPHCTLAVGITDKARVIETVSRFQLPIAAVAGSVQLVEIPGGHRRMQYTDA